MVAIDCRLAFNTFGNPDAQILEINSKSGLYPLYAAYSLYRTKLGGKEESVYLPEDLMKVWDEAVAQIYVLCQTPMAMDITNRTLVGYRSVSTNVKYDKKLLGKLKDSIEKTAKEICKGFYWGKEVKEMKFDAVVGNPPYQEETAQRQSTTNGQSPRKNIFQHFQLVADVIATGVMCSSATSDRPASTAPESRTSTRNRWACSREPFWF